MFLAIIAALLAIPGAKTMPDAGHAAGRAREVLAGCGPIGQDLARLADSAWAARPSALAEHVSLRAALNAPMPEASTRIMFYASGGHLADEWHSVVLVRDAVGTWTGTHVGRSRIWVSGAPMLPTPQRAWTLPAADGEKVDRILTDRCFCAEPTAGWHDPTTGPPPRGGLAIEFETVTPDRNRRVWFLGGSARGRTAELFDLVVPR